MATTTSEYIAQINEVEEGIASRTKQIQGLQAQIPALVQSRDSYNAARDRCASMPDTFKNQKEAKKKCTSDNENARLTRVASINAINAQINNLKGLNQTAQATLAALRSNLQTAENTEREVKTTLADRGETVESVQTRQAGETAAYLQTAALQAETEASGKKKAKNVQLFIVIAVAGVLITAGTILLIRKLKKKP